MYKGKGDKGDHDKALEYYNKCANQSVITAKL